MAPVVDFLDRFQAVQFQIEARVGHRILMFARSVALLGLGLAQQRSLAADAEPQDRDVHRPAAGNVRVENRRVAEHAGRFQVGAAGVDAAQRHTVGHSVTRPIDHAAYRLAKTLGAETNPPPVRQGNGKQRLLGRAALQRGNVRHARHLHGPQRTVRGLVLVLRATDPDVAVHRPDGAVGGNRIGNDNLHGIGRNDALQPGQLEVVEPLHARRAAVVVQANASRFAYRAGGTFGADRARAIVAQRCTDPVALDFDGHVDRLSAEHVGRNRLNPGTEIAVNGVMEAELFRLGRIERQDEIPLVPVTNENAHLRSGLGIDADPDVPLLEIRQENMIQRAVGCELAVDRRGGAEGVLPVSLAVGVEAVLEHRVGEQIAPGRHAHCADFGRRRARGKVKPNRTIREERRQVEDPPFDGRRRGRLRS